VLAEQGRRVRRLMVRMAPDRLGDPKFIDSLTADANAAQSIEPVPLIVEQAS
jgi:hypothetical protein